MLACWAKDLRTDSDLAEEATNRALAQACLQ